MFARPLSIALLVALVVAVAARGSGGSGRAQVHVVRPHDTLWGIAASRYGGDPRAAVWRIQEANGLEGALIRPGQRLRLP